ncbi:MAG: hypothetical protein KC800_00985 [Candidatus Eremiobacteraeota bacterium]|nr:hypothetical protein [Candidatus Eremiobacteraeota bacterium]
MNVIGNHKPAARRPCDKTLRRHLQERPRDVLQARDTFTIDNYQSLGVQPSELTAGARVVETALEDLGEPRIFVNRSLKSALETLREGGPFSTIFDKAKDPELSQDERDGIEFYLLGREAREKHLGTHGEDCLAGHTVYGSLGFSESLSQEMWDDQLLDPPAATERHLNSGISLTDGAVTFVMKPEVNARSTFLPSDTYDTKREKPVAEEHLPFAIWANIGSKGDMYFSDPRGSQVLLDLPSEQAEESVKSFLTSDAINRGYMEAQIRGATLDDVERIVVRRHSANNGSQTEFGSLEEGLLEVKRLAALRGIPCSEATE